MEGPSARDPVALDFDILNAGVFRPTGTGSTIDDAAPEAGVPQRRYLANVITFPSLVTQIGIFFPSIFLALIFGGEAIAGRPSAGLTAAVFAAVIAYFTFRWMKRARKRTVHTPTNDQVWASASGNLIARSEDQRVLLNKDDIVAGYVVPSDNPNGSARVIFEGQNHRLADLWFRDVNDARALLHDLKLEALQRPLTLSFFIGMRVTVGVDGVVVAWPWLKKRRFIPHDQIDDVRWGPNVVRLVLKDGSEYSITTNGDANKGSAESHIALVERLIAARDEWRRSSGADLPTTLALAKNGRALETWIKDLRRLTEGTSGSRYRDATLPVETLWRVALDPAEKEELRIGAGLALRATLDNEGKTRLREAAEAAASPKVRIALTAAADQLGDEAVAEAIRLRREV